MIERHAGQMQKTAWPLRFVRSGGDASEPGPVNLNLWFRRNHFLRRLVGGLGQRSLDPAYHGDFSAGLFVQQANGGQACR